MRQPFDPDALLAAIARGESSCGDFEMRIARDGTWYYQGSPIGRLPLVKLFATVLRRGPDGAIGWSRRPSRAVIEVEDVPFVAVELRAKARDRSSCSALRTNLDEWVAVDAAHPLEMRPQPDGVAGALCAGPRHARCASDTLGILSSGRACGGRAGWC